MNSSVDWQDLTYRKTFEQELRGIRRRRETDPRCTVADLEGILRDLYRLDGAGWGGRGEVQDNVMAATIAAYERAVAEWKAEGFCSE
jgi:hypothetical protein